MPAWLLALLFGAFVFYTDDYVIAGVLPEIAVGLGVSEAAAGQLVTVFSLTVGVAAPVAAVLTARWPRRLVFGIALTAFAAANAIAAATDSYAVLMAMRVLAALAAAMATPALFGVAAVLAPERRRGRYLGTVSLGVTGSIALGVPLGTWIGGAWGWRATFAAMAAAGALALIALLATLPRTRPAPAVPLLEQVRVLLSAPVFLGLLANAFTITGSMMLLTYLAPYLADFATADTDVRAAMFAASGVAGMAGIWLGGLATDRWGADRTLIGGIGAFMAVMAVFTLLWPLRPVPLWVVAPLAVVWAGSAFWNSPAIQARLLTLAGPVGGQALALNTSFTYIGVAVGGALGGILLSTASVAALPPVSAVLGGIALGTFLLASLAARRTAPTA
ncbi:MFS transporter [Allonocardiopsis opalescens]|uniref:Putative MFS family arabinose efflux permease n=1 Tax=Allonocardiopsis opalescens TaxID=1144618 RepID=A0A2T0Q7M5_9ACTN|nr:MFS transporter [Allonocardiopsis opalescens]PRX99816.1 putative MFS family arabinose efflux permease [Allonocardiopsis opalescens]